MAEVVQQNLVYLTKNLTNLQDVLIHCVQEEIITRDEKERIWAGETSLDKNYRFFDSLMKRNWEKIKIAIISILRNTSNAHCADILEGFKYPTWQYADSHNRVPFNRCKSETILEFKWWPDEKHLPKAFLEREEDDKKLIDILKENLAKSKNRSAVINHGTAVSGIGGVGKTTVAKWFAIEFEDYYDYIIWIDSGEDNLLDSFSDLAKELKVDTTLRLKLMSRKCFSKLEKAKCLFIFDNAECYQGHQGVRDVLPNHNNFHTIITSRTRGWGCESGDGEIPEMHLDAFTIEDSIEFLTNNLKDKQFTEDQLEELSELLGNLPLALQIAITAINSKKLSLTTYIELIKKTDHIINLSFDGYEKTINTTMKISLDIIKNHESDDKQIAHRILILLGYINPDDVKIELLQAIENLEIFETNEAMTLLEKYSLVTIDYDEDRMESCSIHRLLQQVIRRNNKENEKVILNKILSVDGFLDYKFIPYTYADEEIQSLFPKVRAQLVDFEKSDEFLEEMRFDEAVEISRIIKDTLNTYTAWYNYAVCLEMKDELTEAAALLTSLHNYMLNETNKCSLNIGYIDADLYFEVQLATAKNIIDECINENGLWKLEQPMRIELVKGLLFLIYSRQGLDDAANELINQDSQLIIITTMQSVHYVIKYLMSHSIRDYSLVIRKKFIFLRLGNNYGKKMSLTECGFSQDLPNYSDELRLEYADMVNGVGRILDYYNINSSISNKLNILSIKCSFETTVFKIEINDNLESCHTICLETCVIQLQKDKRIAPKKIDLRNVYFEESGFEEYIDTGYYDDDDLEDNSDDNDEDCDEDEEEMKVCLNDFIDFQRTKELIIHGGNVWMELDESLSMDEISLGYFDMLDWSHFNCTVNKFNIWNTVVPLHDKDITMRVNIICLTECSVHLTSIYYLSQRANEIKLDKVRIVIDEIGMESMMKICSTDVTLSKIEFIQDSVKIAKIFLNEILDWGKIKSLKVLNEEDTVMIFDLSQPFSIDYLDLTNVQLTNWDTSKSGVKTLYLWYIDMRDISSTQFRVTETLFIHDSEIDFISLECISAAANKVELFDTSIHLTVNRDGNNNPSSKPHCINSQVKELKLICTTFHKDGEEIESFIVNDFINISQLKSLALHTNPEEGSRLTLDLKDVSLSLNILSLQTAHVLNWEKGQGHVDKMDLCDIPFQKRNELKIHCLNFEISSIDLSCLPKCIKRIHIDCYSPVTCKGEVSFNDLNSVILHENHSQLKYFSGCPNLAKVELGYLKDNEFLLNLQWMPKSVKIIKLNQFHRNFFSAPHAITGTKSRQFKLETLVVEGFLLPHIHSFLEVLQPEKLIFCDFHRLILRKAESDLVIKLIKSCKFVAIGKFEWESDEHFENCPFSKYVDGKGELYIFENQFGKVLQEAEFTEMMTL